MNIRCDSLAVLIGAVLACTSALTLAQAGSPALGGASVREQRGTAEQGLAGEAKGLPGRVLLQLRPRYSYTDQANKEFRAQASNMRLLLGYRTAPVADFTFTGELVHVGWLEPKRASNQPGAFASEYPLVGDPDKSDVNLLHADYSGLPDFRIRLGRQMIRLDNERFVGAADVRQMPQVFDAVTVRNTSFTDTEIFAAHAWRLRTYFGNRFQTRTLLLNARYQHHSGLSVGAYAYFQDQPLINNRTGFKDSSNQIEGLRLEGNARLSQGLSWYYTAETAQQRPYANGDPLIRAGYQRLAFGPSWDAYSAQLNYERLGSNQGRYGFQMPLSFNTFQGWAYSFFSTPAEGVRDLNVSFAAALGRANLMLKHHWFRADFGGARLGSEWDLGLGYRVSGSLSVRAVLGQFRSDAASRRPTGPRAIFGQVATPSAQRYYLTLQYDY